MQNLKMDNSFRGITFLEFNLSLGQTEEENKKVYAETKDWRIQYKGVTAMAGASHWQFTVVQIHASDNSCPLTWTSPWDKSVSWTSA